MKDFKSGMSYLHKLTQECGMCGEDTTDDQLVEALKGLIKYAGQAYGSSIAPEEDKDGGSSDSKSEGKTPSDD